MRNMSFMLTTEQVRNRTKTVTRRLGWEFLSHGNLIRAVEKCQGLKKGEKMKHLAFLKVERVRRERLDAIHNYDARDGELAKEGFPQMSPIEFESMFMATHRPCRPDWLVTRIEFSYVEPKDVAELERIDKQVTALNKWGDRLIASGAVKFVEF